MLIYCGDCKAWIAKYQKVGKGNLLTMYLNRIIEGSVDFEKHKGKLYCPQCKKHLATRIHLKEYGEDAYRMRRGSYNTKAING